MFRPGMWAVIAHLVSRLAVDWMVQRSNPSGDNIFCTYPVQPWVTPSLLCNCYHASFPGMKRPRCGIEHPPPHSGGVKERVELYLCSLSVSSWQVVGWTYVYLQTRDMMPCSQCFWWTCCPQDEELCSSFVLGYIIFLLVHTTSLFLVPPHWK